MSRFTIALLLLLGITLPAIAQPEVMPLTICTYNVLNYTAGASADRNVPLSTVVQAINPDILIVIGLANSAAEQGFRNDVLPQTHNYKATPFLGGSTAGNALYFDSTKMKMVGEQTTVSTADEPLNKWTLAVLGGSDTLVIFGCNLPTGEGPNANRFVAARKIREEQAGYLKTNTHFIVAGTLNFNSTDDYDFHMLQDTTTDVGGNIRTFVDPINRGGNWHLNPAAADIATSSTRLRVFGGGQGGGLTDRTDFLLIDSTLLSHYRTDSYTAIGNDGQHYQDSINRPPYNVVAQPVAQALHDASDHLPVTMELQFNRVRPTSAVPEQFYTIPDSRKMDLSELVSGQF